MRFKVVRVHDGAEVGYSVYDVSDDTHIALCDKYSNAMMICHVLESMHRMRVGLNEFAIYDGNK